MRIGIATAPSWQDILICPSCKNKVQLRRKSLVCDRCHKKFPIVNNIPRMIAENANRDGLGKEISEFEDWDAGFIPKRRYKIDRQWLKELFINRKNLPSDAFIVEIGPGPIPVITDFKANIRIGVDALSERYDKLSGLSRLDMNYVTACAESIPLADRTADIIVSINSLDHVDNISLELYEIWRILKPGGHFIVSVYFDSSPILLEEPHVVNRELLEKEVYHHFTIVGESVRKPKGYQWPWYKAHLIKKNINSYKHRFSPAQYAEITRFIRNFTEGLFQEGRGNNRGAIKYFKRALEYPGYYDTDKYRLYYCDLRVRMTMTTRPWEELLKELVTTSDGFIKKMLCDACYKMGSLLKRSGRIDLSKKVFDKVAAVAKDKGYDQTFGGANFHLGEIYLRGKNSQMAKAHFKAALKYIPNHQKAKKYLSESK